jgi:hypothetical protein
MPDFEAGARMGRVDGVNSGSWGCRGGAHEILLLGGRRASATPRLDASAARLMRAISLVPKVTTTVRPQWTVCLHQSG